MAHAPQRYHRHGISDCIDVSVRLRRAALTRNRAARKIRRHYDEARKHLELMQRKTRNRTQLANDDRPKDIGKRPVPRLLNRKCAYFVGC